MHSVRLSNTGLQKIALAALLSGCMTAAFAQYVWLNDKGVKQYSDQPPPPSVPADKILKSPGVTLSPAPTAEADNGGDGNAARKAPPSLADKNAEFQKRRSEQAEKDKKAEEKATQDKARQQNCERARDYQRALTSGQRISRLNSAGEREYLSDDQRAKEDSENKRALADCK